MVMVVLIYDIGQIYLLFIITFMLHSLVLVILLDLTHYIQYVSQGHMHRLNCSTGKNNQIMKDSNSQPLEN